MAIGLINIMNSNNIRISALKGYGILLVVIGHAIWSEGTNGGAYSIRNFIYLFHLAIFYYASGFLYKDKYVVDFKTFLIKRIKSLYIPYVTYGSVFLILHNIFCYIGLYSVDTTYSMGELIKNFFSLLKFNYFEALSGVFWFFKSLFVVSLSFELIVYILHKFQYCKLLIIICLGFLSIVGIGACYYSFPCNKTLANLALLPVFFVGYYVSRNSICLLRYFKRYRFLVIFACFAILLINSNYEVSINAQDIGPNPIIFYVCAFCGIYLTLYVVDHTPKSLYKWIDYIGKNTAPIFIWHFLFFRIASLIIILFNRLNINNLKLHPVIPNHNIIWLFIYIIIGVGGSLLIDKMIKTMKRFFKEKI